MKKILLTFIALLGLTTMVSAQENIVSNPSLEEWSDGKPIDWVGVATNGTYEQSADAHTGSSAIIVKGASGNKRLTTKSYTLQAGTYTYSIYTKQTGDVAGAFRLGYVIITDGKVANTSKDYIYITDAATVTNEWAQTTCEFTLDKETDIELIVMNSKNGGGEPILIDDISLTGSESKEFIVASPTFEYAAGVYTQKLTMKVTTETEGASIHYTIDGTEPTLDNSIKMLDEYIHIDTTMTLKAVAVYLDRANNDTIYSTVTSANYIISEPQTYKEVGSISAGKKYFLVNKANNILAKTVKESDSYGYLYTKDVTIVNNSIEDAPYYAFTIEATEGGYTIKDYFGRYLYMKGTYTSFNVSKTLPDEGGVWTITFNEDGDAVITNILTGKYIQYSEQYSSYGAYDTETGSLPTLFEEVATDTSIEPCVPYAPISNDIYDLLGRKVENPTRGIYIINGKKVILN